MWLPAFITHFTSKIWVFYTTWSLYLHSVCVWTVFIFFQGKIIMYNWTVAYATVRYSKFCLNQKQNTRINWKFGIFLVDYSSKIICDPCCQNETFLCTWSKLSSWYIIKVCILPFIMVLKMLKSDNPKWTFAHLTFGALKSIKWRHRLSKFEV